ncbi:V-type ATP synthase subunit F [Thermoclostridium stercorarium subsp. stercorarium DSM 8532]|jgi:V/A-type H+-transporting ATPase subunit F|uniref:V-type ATP synthase subunit F n=3 Tax=Thermoclostridium stercorarium TaxID=1510 RepID=L7VLJ8_THES1|nr:V-type ATP synthase subunit F [Thermoclostridium stercorarium]AGC67371.1 V-type ATP synthase subunit F [Thermoclostridium stercorarium subsp. stercorarium DSM 8532]AGI38432.1 H+-ATPase subunit F [Thermoclostridium stercorarium subsp. stercorarium DSM 8532]ANW97865.1 V-type ATP synthase subunit F [Thermoclostridium stercorarium subsp. thermolacticum DSM 2910]ANX00419.1 V-type ATP synthase subunit F [Thermoclostridium stercorarium subsp. leptospartum DSM 9219]UZQ85963.1 V-type ATP synthase su
MYKIGVIGEKDAVLGFKSLGFSVFPVENREQAVETLIKLAEENYAVIYITEQTAAKITDRINQYRERRFPAVIPIPGIQGSLGIGMQGVKKCVEKAVGADILFNE